MIVLRAGDVIPQVVSPAPHAVERKGRAPPPTPPAKLPVCATPTVKPEGSVFTKCPNRVCPARQWQLLKHFVSRGAMDIDGLGEKQVGQLQQAGLVTTAGDFYRLTAEQLSSSRATARSAPSAPSRASTRPRRGRSGACCSRSGIEEVGFVTGRNLAQRFRTIDALLAATPEEIEADAGRRAEDGADRSTSSSPTSRCAR